MNIVKLQGGLGNQLFQYSFALYLKEIFNSEVNFDFAENLKKKYIENNLDIQKLGIKLPAARQSDISQFKLLPDIFWRVERKLTQLIPSFNSKMLVNNNPQASVPIIGDTYYDGYYQRIDYVERVLPVLRKQLEDGINKHMVSKSQLAIPDQMVAGVHIRRGDYLNKANARIFEVCGVEYYNEAVRRVEELTGCKKFLIFTQDKEWARENFVGDKFEVFNGRSALEDFSMMSICEHNIIANSTFSWWSAKLNENPNKVVVTPKKWYKNQHSLECFLDERWIQI